MAISTSRHEKKFIRKLAEESGAKNILEVGAFKGETTAVLSEVAGKNGGRVTVIDPMIWSSKPSHFFEWIDGLLHPSSYERMFWKNVSRSGYEENVRLIKKLSTDSGLLSDPDPSLRGFDFVFIDAEHTYEGVMKDIGNWGSRALVGAKILLHDVVKRFPGVVRAMKYLETDPNVLVTWPTQGTVGVVELKDHLNGTPYLQSDRRGAVHLGV